MNDHNCAPQAFNLLVVDDNDDDVLLTKHAFKKLPVSIDFQVAHNGLEALALLRREAPYGDAPTPQIILLDLNMPRMDGRQLLAELKRDEHLRIIPTVILTTSSADDDILDTYGNHANAYIIKPIDLYEFSNRMASFVAYWLSGTAALPVLRNRRLGTTTYASQD